MLAHTEALQISVVALFRYLCDNDDHRCMQM